MLLAAPVTPAEDPPHQADADTSNEHRLQHQEEWPARAYQLQ
jgi:hypothetical protein